MNYEIYKYSLFKRIKILLKNIFIGLYKSIINLFINIYKSIIKLFTNIKNSIKMYILNFKDGNLLTKISYLFMGMSHLFRGKMFKGIIYIIIQISFYFFMILFGSKYLIMFFENIFVQGSIGRVETTDFWNEELGIYDKVAGDNSFHIVLYGILTIFLLIFYLIIYFNQTKESYLLEQYQIINKKPIKLKEEINTLLDKKFQIPLLSIPLIGLLIFTVIPLLTMILIAFTNYDASHEVPEHLFSWVGFSNFKELFSTKSTLGSTFYRVLGWTLIWAVFATFTSYFFGMLIAILINKKGIKFKKLYRTLFITVIAVPQFVSLLIMSKMLDTGGGTLYSGGGVITQFIEKVFNYHLKFGLDINTTRICIVLVNMWIGVPYSMLMCSGILMNIPSDLYESARVDGASKTRMFFKITLPYMLFVTGPYLITQFIGNINNFNVIYLLSGGGPGDLLKYTNGAKGTDLLITWLYKLSLGENRDYKLASVIGILVFIISAVFSLIVFNKSSAVKNEETFQ